MTSRITTLDERFTSPPPEAWSVVALPPAVTETTERCAEFELALQQQARGRALMPPDAYKLERERERGVGEREGDTAYVGERERGSPPTVNRCMGLDALMSSIATFTL